MITRQQLDCYHAMALEISVGLETCALGKEAVCSTLAFAAVRCSV